MLLYKVNREKVKQAIALYQSKKYKADFIRGVGCRTYSSQEVWEIIDQLFDLLAQCEKCGHKQKIDFKDLY